MISSRNVIFDVIYKIINNKQYQYLPELIDILNKNQSLMMNILDNEVMNSTDRNLLLNASKDAINIYGVPQKVILSQEYIQEAIIISNMFKLNEMTAVELLMSGEAEKTSNLDMTRGLLAVLSYYESQKTIVESLRLLLQAKLILTDDCTMSIEVVNYIEAYLDKIFNGGLFNYIVTKIKSMNIDEEVAMLESQRALGTPKHRRQFYTLFDQIKKTLCECIMLRAFKSPLNKNDTKQLIYLVHDLYNDKESLIKKEESTFIDHKHPKNIDYSLAYLIMSLLCSFNPIIEGNSVINYSKECFNHPFFSDDDFKKDIDTILKDNIDKNNYSGNEIKTITNNIDHILYLSWIISLQKVSQLKKEHNINNHYQLSTSFGDYDDTAEIEILHIDSQTIYECFQFLIKIIDIQEFHEENIWIKCIHDLITDFIIFMPKMLKDLRTESMRIKSNVAYYSSLLDLIGKLYGGGNRSCEIRELQSNSLLESLVLEYWSPQEIINYSDSVTLLTFEDNFKRWNVKSNDSCKQAILFKFIRDSGDLIDNPQVFISYVFMLKGLCCSDRISIYIYSLLNNNQISHQPSRLTWEWFSNSLQKHAHFLMSTPHTLHTMAPVELNGLLVVLQLIKCVSQCSKIVCSSMINNESLMMVQNVILLLSCRVPETLKAELFNCLAVFCVNGLVAKSIWQALASQNIITRSVDPMSSSILIELDQNEPKFQEYFITRAFLNLLLAEVPYIVSDLSFSEPLTTSYDHMNQSVINSNLYYSSLDSFTNVLHMVMDTVFLKYAMRTYRNIEEKFIICERFLKLCCKCVDIFMAQVGNAKITKGKLSWCQYDPGFFIINQLLNDSLFFKTLISIIDCGFAQINDCLNNSIFGSRTLLKDTIDSLQKSISYAMTLLHTILSNEVFLIQLLRDLNSKIKKDETNRSYLGLRFRNCVPQELSSLLMSSSSTQRFLPNLIKYVSIVDESEEISRKALSILILCVDIVEPHSNLLLMLTNKNIIDIEIMPLFVNCIDKYGDADSSFIEILENKSLASFFFSEYCPDSPRTLVLKLLLTSLKKSVPSLGHYLLGFLCDSYESLKRTSLQEAGVGECPKTCLHSVLNLIQRLSCDILASACFDSSETTSDQLMSLTVNMIDLNLALQIVYKLVSDSNTAATVLRFIRSNYQLIINQMDLLSFKTEKVNMIPELQALFWNQKSWLLKIIAIEVRHCTASQQKSYMTKLLGLLFGEDTFEMINESVFNKFYGKEHLEPSESEGLIFELLEDMNITENEEIVDFSRCTQRFKPEILKEYLNQCVQEDAYNGLKLMNGEKLKQLILVDVISTVEDEQMNNLMREVEAVCLAVDKYNVNEILMTFGKRSILEGWRQVVEVVMVSECSSEESVDVTVKALKICEILVNVMQKILVSTTPYGLISPLGTLCLVMTAVLGATFSSHLSGGVSIIENDLDRSYKTSLLNNDEMNSQLSSLINLTSDCILRLNTKHQNTRIKLYATMTYLLQIVLKNKDNNNLSNTLLTTPLWSLSALSERCLYPTLCRDAVSGNVHLALSSLTLLDIMASIDKDQGGLVTYLVSNGYLQHLINSLTKDCASLFLYMKQEHSDENSAISYYLYQSKMSLFCKLASMKAGANMLVQYGLLNCLSRCDVFRVRPLSENRPISMDYDNEFDNDGAYLSVQYTTILGLTVQLATSILSTEGLEKGDCIREVHIFIGEFIDTLCTPFQSSASARSSSSIKEVINISSLFVLLSSALLRTECSQQEGYHYNTVEKIKTASSQMLACLLGLLNEHVYGKDDTMQWVAQMQLMNKLISVVTAIVSSGSQGHHKMLFFANNIEGVLSCRNNWNANVKKICQKMFSRDKPPMTMLVMVLFKVQDCIADITRKISRISEQILVQDKSLSLEQLEQSLEKMSTDQVKAIWNAIFECSSPTFNPMSMEYLDSESSSKGLLSTKNDLMRDLLIIFQKMTSVKTGLIESLECCSFLLWHHINNYKSASTHGLSSHTNGDLHPIQRLQIMEQETKKELIENCRLNNNKSVDIVTTMAKCLDQEFLDKMQYCLEENCGSNELSFSRIMIHQLTGILKFA